MDIVNPGTVNLPRYLTGIYGVQLFLSSAVSSFFMTLEKSKHAMDFVVFVLHYFIPAIGLWFLMVVVFGKTLKSNRPRSALKYNSFNLTGMFQHWVGIENIDGVYWTLSVELTFYLIMLVLFMTKQLKTH